MKYDKREMSVQRAVMYKGFTDRARRVMALANQEAQRLNHGSIGTEHILLGLVEDRSGVGANVLKNFGIEIDKLRVEVAKLVPKEALVENVAETIPLTDAAKKIVACAHDEARALGHNYAGTEHLLLALLADRDGVHHTVLTNLGIKPEEVRNAVFDLLGADSNEDSPPLDKDGLTFAIGPEGMERTFGSIEEVLEFIDSEREQWGWLDHKKATAIKQASDGLAQVYRGRFDQLGSYARQYKKVANANKLVELTAQFDLTYTKEGILYSGSPEGKFVLRLKDDDVFVAAGALAYLSKKPSPEQRNTLTGRYMAFLFDKGLLGQTAIDPYRESWEEISTRFSNSANDVEQRLQMIIKDSTGYKNQHDLLVGDMEALFGEFLEDAKKQRAGLQEAYGKHMSLQAPVDYWDAQRTESDKKARYYWKIVVATSIGGIVLFVWLVDMWFKGAGTDAAAEVSIASWAQQVPLWRIAVVFIATSMWVWILRLLVRNLLSHIHIASTAGERVVMTKAYLALLRDKNVDKEHIEIILRNLFRPIATGIVKDDASPTFMVDLVERATKKL